MWQGLRRWKPCRPTSPKLRWKPPVLSSPITLNLGTGESYHALDNTRDYIVKFPSTPKDATTLIGGRNIVIMGGQLRKGHPKSLVRALFIDGAVGTVHIEGISIDNSTSAEGDGIAIRAPKATVQIQNTRIYGILGSQAGDHGDIVQPWGGVAKLRIDRMSGSTGYQGLFLRPTSGPIGSIELSNMDLNYDTKATSWQGGDLLWLTTDCVTAPTTLSEVYINRTAANQGMPKSIWPKTTDATCAATTTKTTTLTTATWPTLPVTGVVKSGLPTTGEFVPKGTVGSNYTSPGYLG